MLTIDIELTNHCNARCSFCPRDAMPHEGVMRAGVFERTLERAVEFRTLLRRLGAPFEPTVVFCGTGEPLVHRRAVEYVGRVCAEGFPCQVSTNGALLSAETATALLDAGLGCINLNVSEVGDDYERVYGLPFERTRDNVVRVLELARGRCTICLIVVDHRRDPEHLRVTTDYWRARGAHIVEVYGFVNRGGSLATPAVAWPTPPPTTPELAAARSTICSAPFMHLFVGYDGHYYLCSSDWRKEVSFGSVFQTSFAAITAAKLARAASREPICKRCSLEPTNLLRRRAAGDATCSRPFEGTIRDLLEGDRRTRAFARELMASVADEAAAS